MQIVVPLWKVPFSLSFTLYPACLDRSHIYYRVSNPTRSNPIVKIAMYEDGVFLRYYHISIYRPVHIDCFFDHLLLPCITYSRDAY